MRTREKARYAPRSVKIVFTAILKKSLDILDWLENRLYFFPRKYRGHEFSVRRVLLMSSLNFLVTVHEPFESFIFI